MLQVIKANGEDSLLTMAVEKYGSIAALFDIALLNNLDIDAVPAPGVEIQLPVVDIVAYKTLVNKRKPVAKAIVTAGADQALVDLAMQECGSIDRLFEFAQMNGVSVTDDLVVGQQYKKPSVSVQKVVDVFSGAHKPASSITVPADQLPENKEGIDYWYIDIDFKVS